MLWLATDLLQLWYHCNICYQIMNMDLPQASNVGPQNKQSTAPVPAGRRRSQGRHKREMRNLIKRGRIWYFKKMVGGAQAYVSLDTEDLELAKAKRDEKLRQANRDELDKIKGPRSARTATIEEVLTQYAKVATVVDRIEASTVKANAAALKNFLRWAHGTHGRRDDALVVDRLKAEVLTDELVAKFKVNYVAAAGEDRVAREERRRGAASLLRQMRSVFSERARLLYKDLALPKLDNFLTAAHIEAERRAHLLIQNCVLARMEEVMTKQLDPPMVWGELGDIGREQRQALWLVHVLHKFAALRNEEIEQVRVEWFCRAPWGQVFLSVITRPYYEPKGSPGHVPLTTGVAQLLAPFVQNKQPGDFLVLPKGTKTDRENLVNRVHAEWIRQFLPADQYAKAGYELRRWAAQTMETRYGREAAEAFLRHAPKTVAERHYFERWYPWRRVGTDVGITLEDARGVKEDPGANLWIQGADALSGLTNGCSDQAESRR